MLSINDVRTAHSEGPTFAAYASLNNSIVTAGSDGDIRIYPGLYDEESASVSLGLKITCLAVQSDIIVIATDFHEVKCYKLPELEVLHNILLRFTSPINYVCISKNKEICAAASSDFTIKAANTDGTSQKTYSGHSAPVLSLCFTNNFESLISNSCDGTIRVWNVLDQMCTKVIDILPKSNSASQYLGVMAIYDKTLAVPIGNNIKLISTQTWKDDNLILNQHSEKVSCVSISTCGKYLASSSSNGELFTWNLLNKSIIKKYIHPQNKGITSLSWKEKKSEILFANVDGEFGFVEVLEKNVDNDEDVQNVQLFNDDKFEEDFSLKKAKKRINENDIEFEEDLLTSAKKRHRVNNLNNFLDDNDDSDTDDDDPNISLNLIKEGLLPKPSKEPIVNENDDSNSIVLPITEKEKKPVFHLPFQPSSTPPHLMHRFMVWNSIGIIRCHSEDEVSSIDVEFHNASTHYPLHIANVLNNTMGTLSNTVIVLAAEKDGDTPSKITCHHFSTWDSNKEWSLSLPLNESIQVIAANDSYVILATTQQYLRFFTISGIQTQVCHLPGSVVTMAVHDKQLLIVYNRAIGYSSCHCLGVLCMHFIKNNWKVYSDNPLNLRDHLSLVWLGFSTEGSPVYVDSSGDVFLWQRQNSLWVPVTNTRNQAKNKADNFWVIGVEEQEGKIRCILCKGANIPSTLPRPVPTFIPFQVPLCEMTSEKSIKESELLKTSLILSNVEWNNKLLNNPVGDFESTEKQQVALLMQLFALACKSDRDFRAVEICQLMPNIESIGLAIQYATKMRRMNLAQKLDDLARARASNNNEIEAEEENFFSDNDGLELEELDENDSSTELVVEKPTRLEQQSSYENDPCLDIQISNEQELSRDSKKILKKNIVGDVRDNPFKVDKLTGTAVRGTHRFESIEKNPKSKSEEDAVLKKQPNNSGQRKIILPSKTKKDLASKTKENTKSEEFPKKKISGFQRFLEERQNGNQNDEDVLQSAMIDWKKLSADEKQKWNNSSAQIKIDDPKINDKEKEIRTNQIKNDGQEKEFKGQSKEILESKKLNTKENIESKKNLKQNGIASNNQPKKIVEKTGGRQVKKTDDKVKAKALMETKNIKPSTSSTATLKSFAFKKNDT
ncbi:WD repeat and HMG-box DNA-binding protein 1 isoform X2 [Hydra vulgaris]|uniref:WD repeat and HMG-box DNA-binding protein 1 isoform X2 n=1 Tax=Hydra vulgaris TaxID=6087 RepID=A0ABM4C0V0_HYDVU